MGQKEIPKSYGGGVPEAPIDGNTYGRNNASWSVVSGLSGVLQLGETSTTAYRGDRGKTAYDHSLITSGNPHNVTKTEVGLSGVTNDAQLKIASNLSDVNNRQIALNNLTDVSSASNSQVLSKDIITGDALFKDLPAILWDRIGTTLTPHTVNDDVDLLSGVLSAKTVKFPTNITTPSFTEGQVFYDKTWKTLAVQIDDDVTVQLGEESLQYVYNNSGVDISDGQPVYKTGVAGTDPVTITIALAKANMEATSNVVGVATTYIANGTYGFITCRGYINNFNTTTFGTVGNDLWLSPTTAGALTTTRPTSPNVQVKIGTLIVNHATLGRIHVTPVSWGELFSMSELKANQFPGISTSTPITNANISIDYSTLVLTITPPLGYMHYFTDGNGVITKHEVIGNIAFPAFTNTSGTWYFYFNHSGVAITTQTAWAASDFPSVAPVYRLLWNATLTGSARSVAEYIEYHLNDIPADTHQWFHLSGSIWSGGLGNGDIKTNALVSGAPNADGRNTVIALTTTQNIDDNLEYTITNSTAGTAWTQDLGNITPASLNATNSGLFQVFYQNAGGLISFTPATRFPFPWSGATNRPQYFTPAGAIVEVSGSNFMTVFIYATQNPRPGEALKIVTATTDFTSITNARAFNWVDIQNSYLTIGIDNEIRPMYRLIFEFRTGSYNVGCKYSVLREVQDLRKTIVTSIATASGSIPASSVTFIPAGNISSTNVQSALEELDLEKASIDNSIAYAIALG